MIKYESSRQFHQDQLESEKTAMNGRAKAYMICSIIFIVLAAAAFLTRGSGVLAWGDTVIACVWFVLSMREKAAVRSVRKDGVKPDGNNKEA